MAVNAGRRRRLRASGNIWNSPPVQTCKKWLALKWSKPPTPNALPRRLPISPSRCWAIAQADSTSVSDSPQPPPPPGFYGQGLIIAAISSIVSPSRLSLFDRSRSVRGLPSGSSPSGMTSQDRPFFSESWNCFVSFSSLRNTSQGMPLPRSLSANACQAPPAPGATQATAALA